MGTPRRQRIPEERWESVKATIRRLYLEEDKKLEGHDGVMDIMLRQHDFCASKSQFETKLKSWGLAKYAKKLEWKALEQIVAARKAEGKLTDVYLYGERLKRSKVRKETTRHRHGSLNNTTLQDLVRHLPHYVAVRTPTIEPASLPPNNNQHTRPCMTPPQAMLLDASPEDRLYSPSVIITSTRHCTQNENSEPLDVVLVGASKSYLSSLHPSPDRNPRHLEDSFDLLPDRIDDFRFDEQFTTRSSLPCFPHGIDIAAFDRPMQTLITMKSSLQRSFELLQGCNPSLLGKILREWKKSMRRPIRPLQDVEAGKTGELLRELPLDFAVVYRVMFIMINNLDVLDRLKDSKVEHAFLKAGIQYMHCLPDAILNRFLNSIAPPFSYPFEQSLLCSAVELGANRAVNVILQRRCLDLENVVCIISRQTYTLLERSVQLCHFEITSALLAYGLDPNRYLTTRPIKIWAALQTVSDREKLQKETCQEWNEDKGKDQIEDLEKAVSRTVGGDEDLKTPTAAVLDLFTLLFYAGAKLYTHLFEKQSFSGQTLRFLLDTIHGPRFDLFINSGFLSGLARRIHRMYAHDDVIFIAKSVLNRDYSDHTRKSFAYRWELRRALYEVLSSASPNMELIKTFLSAGAILDTECLKRAVVGKQVEVVKLLLLAGVTPDTKCLSHAISGKHVEVVKALIYAGATPDTTCLANAVANGDTKCVELLLFAGARPNTNCLLIAIGGENLEQVKTLISAGAVPNSKCLFNAVCRRNIRVVKVILSAGTTPEARCLPKAISSGDMGIVEVLLSAGVKPNVECLLEAVRCQSVRLVELLLFAGLLPDAQCLAAAAYHSNLELVNILLSAGAVPDAESLFRAVVGGCVKITERFLDLGVSANTMTRYGRTPLVEAIQMRRNVELQLFESKGFLSELSLNHASRSEALQAACRADNPEVVQFLLSDIQKDPSSLPSYLVKWMLQNGYQEVALKLVEFGASPDADDLLTLIKQRNSWLLRRCIDKNQNLFPCIGKGILYQAVQWGDLEVIKALVHAGVHLHEHATFVNQLEEYSPLLKKGQTISATPLVTSIWMGKREITNVLLNFGALIHRHSEKGTCMSPLTAAIIMRDSDLVRDLLQRGADPYDNLAIAVASFSQNLPLAMYLLERFAQFYPMGRADFGASALHEAIIREDLPMLTVLAKYIDGNIRLDATGDSSLYLADTSSSPLTAAITSQSENHIQMMRILLESNTNAKGKVSHGYRVIRPPIIHAISNLRLATVELLIEHGAELNIEARPGVFRTPLQLAAELGAEDIVQCLLRHVDPNEPAAFDGGGTALQLASIKGHCRIAVLLLGRGAGVNAAPAQIHGRTAFEGAAEHGRMDMMFLLAQHGVELLANDEAQYKRAIKYSKANGQIGAMKLVEQMYEQAIAEIQMEGILTPGLFLDESMVANEPFDDWSTFDSR